MTWLVVLLAIAASAAMAWGWFEAGWLRRRVIEVELEGVPPELDGIRIAHLSDLHLGVWTRGGRGREPLPADVDRCYVVLGNHDFADSRDPFSQRIDPTAIDALEGVTLLAEEAVELELRGRRGRIVGVDPRTYADQRAHPEDLADTRADLRVLLCHFPGIARRLPGVFHLILAGHFHAGQIVVPYPGGRARLAHLRARDVEGVYQYGSTGLPLSPSRGRK